MPGPDAMETMETTIILIDGLDLWRRPATIVQDGFPDVVSSSACFSCGWLHSSACSYYFFLLGLSKIMICIQYVMIILNYYDYITTHCVFWVPWLQLSTIQYDYEYNMIWWSYLIIIIMYSSATEMHNSGAVPACMCHIWSCRDYFSAGTPQPYIITSLIACSTANQLAWNI